MQEVVRVEKLIKSFQIAKPFSGIAGTLKNLFFAEKSTLSAIAEISFSINQGERIAFIGSNGAGKSTTIKILTGILHPTAGHVEVLSLVPWKNRHILGYKIGTVFGQRTQLWPHLPPSDTFNLLSKIYNIKRTDYENRLKKLTEVFEIGPFFYKPVRQLSLGERMRCELVASLLHNPQILFLDEPTIGLDINAKLKIRSFINNLSKDYGTTLFLTSHDTADIEQVCERVIVLDRGSILLNCSVKELKKKYFKKKILSIRTDTEKLSLNLHGIDIRENNNYQFVCEVNLEVISIDHMIHEILKQTSLKDVTIEDPSMDEIIRFLYSTDYHG